jgi:hypothetical protein
MLAAAALAVGLGLVFGFEKLSGDGVVSGAAGAVYGPPDDGGGCAASAVGTAAVESGALVWEAELEVALAAAQGDAEPVLAEIERLAGPALAEVARPYWQALADVTPAVRSLRARHDSQRYAVLSRSTVAVWQDLLAIYLAATPTPRLRDQLLASYPAAAGLCRWERGGAGAGTRVAAAAD